MDGDREEQRAWALLLRTPGINRERVAQALQSVASAAELVRASDATLARLGIPDHARLALRTPDAVALDADLEWLDAPGHHLLPLTSTHFPPLLANTTGAP